MSADPVVCVKGSFGMKVLRNGNECIFHDNKVDSYCLKRATTQSKQASGWRSSFPSINVDGLPSRSFSHLSGLMLVALFGLMPSFVDAVEICMPADELDAALMEWYGETVVGPGPNGTVLWASDTSKTWTLVKYSADGEACSVSHGTDMPENFLLVAME